MIKTELTFETEMRRYLFAFTMHFTHVELSDVEMVIGKYEDAFDVGEVVFEIAIISFLVWGFQLAITLLDSILNVSEELLLMILSDVFLTPIN